jgi:type II secretory pathway predicted ATPase ExeA
MLIIFFRIFFRIKNSIISKRPENPYVTGNVVGESHVFIGRTDILQAIDKILCHSKENAVVLFGERRIGKTSVLTKLKAKLAEQGNYQSIYLIMDQAHQSLESLLNDITDTICQELLLPPQRNNTKKQFHDWLIALLNKQSLVLLFDEFDVCNDIKEPIREDFLNYLKVLLSINTKRLNIFFTIGCDINDFKETLTLFENMSHYHVSTLDKEETCQLIRLSENNQSLFWSDEAVQKVWELTHGHPFLTQMLCSCIWQQAWSASNKIIPLITSQEVDIDRIASSGLPACKEAVAALTD